MSDTNFLTLLVRDLSRARRFYEAIGFKCNHHLSDATTACMACSETMFLMLVTTGKKALLTTKNFPAINRSARTILCISRANRQAVDSMIERAAAAGGRPDPLPKRDTGLIYSRSFEDLDDHMLEAMWMDDATRITTLRTES